MDYFSKRYHPPGTSPGTLTRPEGAEAAAFVITLVDYSESEFLEKELATVEECQAVLSRPTMTWIDIAGDVSPAALSTLGELLGLHHLALEDVLNTGQRPKIEEYEDQLFVVLSAPNLANDKITLNQVSFFAGENFVVSFHHGNNSGFGEIRNRLRKGVGRIRTQKVDFLLYALIDTIIDHGFPLLDSLGERLEDIEEELLAKPTKSTLNDIHLIKRELLLIRKALWPQREVVNYLLREEHPLITPATKVYFRDCYDHTVQIIDLLETYRDMTASMLDVYLSSISNRLNEVMKVLTIIATIFMPLTFIVGLYGMNFGNGNTEGSPWAMPELNWYYGYPMAWLVMIAVTAGMLIYFKRKKWL